MLYLSEPNKCFIESGRLLIHIDKNHRFPPGRKILQYICQDIKIIKIFIYSMCVKLRPSFPGQYSNTQLNKISSMHCFLTMFSQKWLFRINMCKIMWYFHSYFFMKFWVWRSKFSVLTLICTCNIHNMSDADLHY